MGLLLKGSCQCGGVGVLSSLALLLLLLTLQNRGTSRIVAAQRDAAAAAVFSCKSPRAKVRRRSQPLRTRSSGLCVGAGLCATAYEQVKLDRTRRKRRVGAGRGRLDFYHSNSNFLGIVKGRYL